MDSTLRPDFALAELSRGQWRNPALRRLVMMAYIVWPPLVGESGEEIAYRFQGELIRRWFA